MSQLLVFNDHDGDPIAVESSAIVGLSVGTLNGPHTPGADVTVTLIWAAGAAQPFLVSASFEEVLARWTQAREAPVNPPAMAHPGVFPLVAHQYDQPEPPAWKAEAGYPKKDGRR